MRHIWTVFCRSVLEDKNTNNPSLIEIIERLAFSGELTGERRIDVPFPFPFSLVSSWRLDDESDCNAHQARVQFVAPDGETLLTFAHDVDFMDHERTRTIGRFASLPYTENGTYEFEISCQKDGGWTPVASIPLEIIREEPDRESSEPGT